MVFFGGKVARSGRAGNRSLLSRLTLPGAGPESGAEPFHGQQPVSVLGPGVGCGDGYPGGEMLQAHGRRGLVPMLAAGAGSLVKG